VLKKLISFNMSDIASRNSNRNQITFDYDYTKLFLFDNKYRNVSIANATGAVLSLKAGTVIGAVGVTYGVYKSGTANQLPVGVLAENIDIANGDTVSVSICVSGRIAESQLVLDGTDTLSTIVSNRSIRDRLASDTLGIELAGGDELTKIDN
jgi:hypothetical protein